MSTPPSASDTVAAGSELEKAIQDACETLENVFKAEYDDNRIKKVLIYAWTLDHRLQSYLGGRGYKPKGTRGCPGGICSKMVHCFRSFDAEHSDHHILSLEAFLKPKSETNPARALRAQ